MTISKEAMGRLLLEASTGMHGEVAKQLCDAWAEMAAQAITHQQLRDAAQAPVEIVLQQNGAAHQPGPALEAAEKARALRDALSTSPIAKPERVRHVVSGREYDLLGDAMMQTDTPVSDMHLCRLYRGDDGRYWVRPVHEFSVRFVTIAPPSTPTQPKDPQS